MFKGPRLFATAPADQQSPEHHGRVGFFPGFRLRVLTLSPKPKPYLETPKPRKSRSLGREKNAVPHNPPARDARDGYSLNEAGFI